MREVTEVCSVNYASHEKRRECLLSSDAHAWLLATPPNEQLARRLGQFLPPFWLVLKVMLHETIRNDDV